MLSFRTELKPRPSPFRMDRQQALLSLGSCFADVIGDRLLQNKFRVLVNPFGTLFHPISIVRLLEMAMHEKLPPPATYLYYQERWINYLLHSSVHGPSREVLQHTLAQKLKAVKQILEEGSTLMLTLGTSFLYELKQEGLPVANCHKQPQTLFHKRLVPAEESLQALDALWQLLHQQNPQLRLILTLSPVRHLKDSLELNSVSKALLRVVCHHLAERYPQHIYYFPSYELLQDDLRDYRFYKDDLLHPTPMAEQYVWEKFAESLLNAEAQAFIQKWEPLQQALRHKAFNPTSAAHRQFLQNTLLKVEALASLADVQHEIQMLREQLKP